MGSYDSKIAQLNVKKRETKSVSFLNIIHCMRVNKEDGQKIQHEKKVTKITGTRNR